MIASERLVFLSVPPKWRVVAIFTLTVIFFLPTHGAAQTNWPMPGHDAQHTGRANFAGPISAPTAPSWTFSTASPIVGDIVTSVEGTLYFASDQLYALKPDGTAFAPSVSIGVPATGPVVDDASGLIYIAAAAADGGFDLLRLTKQLQSAAVVLHVPRPPNGAIISPLVLGRGGLVFFVAGRFPGVVYAAGPVQWSNPACPAEAGPNTPFGASANGPVVSPDGSSLFVMCGGRDGFKPVNSAFESAVESRPSAPAFERHYSVNEVAEMWNLAYNTIKAMFKNEPGVFAIGSEETRYGRPRITLRIPESVLLRVHKKRTRVM
jgi:hypothetical protein